MFAAGRILRQNRRLSSLPAGGGVPAAAPRPKKEKRKFRCYLPFMWSALAMSCLGISIILTGTAMCVAGWYLGHFADYGVRPEPEIRVTSSNASAAGVSDDGSPTVDEITISALPAKSLAYAGPIVMSFGCFAVVFACVVVCETRDRILETMETRVRRGLPARPPGGIQADFYSLVVEFRKRRAEKQRRRRKLIQRDDDEDEPLPPEVAPDDDTGRPSTPLVTSPDLQTPSTINFFVEDHTSPLADRAGALSVDAPDASCHPDSSEPLMVDRAAAVQVGTPRWRLTPSVPDYLRFTAADVELHPMDRSPYTSQTASQCAVVFSDTTTSECPPTFPLCRTSAFTSVSAGDIELCGKTETTLAPPVGSSLQVPQQPEVDRRRTSAAHAQSSYPLLAPIASLAESSAVLPYVRLEPSAQRSTLLQPTSFLHTASVHAIADRSPDIVVTSFEFPPPGADFLSGCDAASGCAARNSGADVEPHAIDVTPCEQSVPVRVPPHSAVDLASTESPVAMISDRGTDMSYAAKRRPDNTSLHVPSVGPWSVDNRRCLEGPTLSSLGDDCGPSRKRSRGTTVGDIIPTVYQQSCSHDGHSPPLQVSPTSYLISAPSVPCETDSAAALAAATGGLDPRRRRSRQALTTRHRRRRPTPRLDPTSGAQNARMSGSEDERRGGDGSEHHSDGELDTLLGRDLARTSTDGADDVSRLIWLRRRTSPTSLRHQRLTDSCQSTV